jgi:hypothetical protein
MGRLSSVRRLIWPVLASALLAAAVAAGRSAGQEQPPLPVSLAPLPSLALPSLPLPSVPLSPLPSVSSGPLPSVSIDPLPSVSIDPLPSKPLPSVSIGPLPTASPAVSVDPASRSPTPRTSPPGSSAAAISPPPSDPRGSAGVLPALSDEPRPDPAQGGAPGDGNLGLGGVIVPALAVGIPAFLALAVLLVQLAGGAAALPTIRRTLGNLGFRRVVPSVGAPRQAIAPESGAAEPSNPRT